MKFKAEDTESPSSINGNHQYADQYNPGTETRPTNTISIALIDPRPLRGDSFSEFISRTAKDFRVDVFPDLVSLNSHSSTTERQFNIILLSVGATALTEELVRSYILELRSMDHNVSLVILSDCEELHCMRSAVSLGVRGYIPTTLTSSVAIAALRLVSAGGIFIPSETLCHSVTNNTSAHQATTPGSDTSPALNNFTPRQIEVMEHLKIGNSNKVIAAELGVQESTVKVHVREVMKKLQVTNRTQAALTVARIFSG